MAISALVFDMDGLLLDTEPIYKAAWQQASTELGFDLDDLSYSRFTGRSTADCEGELVRWFGTDFPMSRFRARWRELWRLSVESGGIATKAGLHPLLTFVKDQAFLSAVATSSDAHIAAVSLRSAGIADRFDALVSGDQVARGKPAPDIYLEAARRLGRDPARCVALEDSDAGVLAASSAGMVTVCIPDLKPPSREAAAAASCVLASLNEAREWIGRLVASGR
jgi:beta-phosphoglucomutase-like phosphatase (HAD superfamily)